MKRASATTLPTCVPRETMLERLRRDACAFCDLSLSPMLLDEWRYCPCCEGRFLRFPLGWKAERSPSIIGLCEHGA